VEALAELRRFYGLPPSSVGEARDPFAAIVRENAAYLVDDARRSRVFERLQQEIGIDPVSLLAAGVRKIEAVIAEGGMQPQRRAAKVVACAEIALEYAGGDLLASLRGLDPTRARALLKRFPGIGDPGADKLLLFAGLSETPALDSNGLRVLERLGSIAPSPSYAASYRAGVAYLRADGVVGASAAGEAFLLLQHHGRQLCKRTHPLCLECPLRRSCSYWSFEQKGACGLRNKK
jgi:endonuclease III